MVVATASLDKHGRLVIPANFRKEMGWEAGDRLTLAIDERELRVLSRRQAIENLRAVISQHVPAGVSLADELIADRREEARHEDEEHRKSGASRNARRGRASRG
jgi:AbrB family looped-hinge helix DNA binding protein